MQKSKMEIARTIQSVRQLIKAARDKGRRIGLVPTMGALHAGHISLFKAAGQQADFIVVSIFVNPAQFGPGEDFNQYPRPFDEDLKSCREHGVDIVFAPSAEQMYPGDNLTWVTVEKLTEGLCGQFRRGHFRGVTTICAKLFNIVQPDAAFFGQKDAQQAVVIRRMVADLNMPLEIVVCPTVREGDGLAVSSRNRYLSAAEREDAACIYKSLRKGQQSIEEGVTSSEEIIAEMQKILRRVASVAIEYISIVDVETLQPVDKVSEKVFIAVAVKIGTTRLIDNILIDIEGK